MKKIPTIFQRDWEGNRSLVTREPNPDAAWVFAGEGVATQKHDGTSCLIKDGLLFKRYELKPGKTPPEGFFPAQDVDPETGKQPGWVPVGDGPDDKAHREGFEDLKTTEAQHFKDGTFELVGPKVQGNPDKYPCHKLIPHGYSMFPHWPRDYDGIKAALEESEIEGVVWHHPDGRMCKVKARDFGIPWPRKP